MVTVKMSGIRKLFEKLRNRFRIQKHCCHRVHHYYSFYLYSFHGQLHYEFSTGKQKLQQNFVHPRSQHNYFAYTISFLFFFFTPIEYIARSATENSRERKQSQGPSTISDSRASFHYTLSLNHELSFLLSRNDLFQRSHP